MKKNIEKKLRKILELLQNINFFTLDGHVKLQNQKNVNKAYSELFDLIQFIENVEKLED